MTNSPMSNTIKVLNYDPADPDKMRLPKGSNCGNCHHIRRCKAMLAAAQEQEVKTCT